MVYTVNIVAENDKGKDSGAMTLHPWTMRPWTIRPWKNRMKCPWDYASLGRFVPGHWIQILPLKWHSIE
jgi:hypothetical protein